MPRAATLPYQDDQIITAVMASSLHADAWAVFWDLPAYPERYAARLAVSRRRLTCCWGICYAR